jgi:hypothetical protein
MRDIVGERAFEVALAACNLYHGLLWAGRSAGQPLAQTLPQLREGAFALADEAMAERQTREARRAKRGGTAAQPVGQTQAEQGEEQGDLLVSGKRQHGGALCMPSQENVSDNAAPSSPGQQHAFRRQRVSEDERCTELMLPDVAGVSMEPQVAAGGCSTEQQCLCAPPECGSGQEGGSFAFPAGGQPVQSGLLNLRIRLQAALCNKR